MWNRITNVLLTLAIIIGLVGLGFNFVFVSIIVEGASMEPTLHDLDYGYMDTKLFHLTGIERFDIVVIDRGHETYYIKRVVALPGETVSSYGGHLYIDGVVIDQPFIDEAAQLSTVIVSRTLGENEYFVLGDNRQNSVDSRSFGPIVFDDIVASGLLLTGTCNDSNCTSVDYTWPEWVG